MRNKKLLNPKAPHFRGIQGAVQKGEVDDGDRSRCCCPNCITTLLGCGSWSRLFVACGNGNRPCQDEDQISAHYPAAFFACARTFAQRFFAAFAIFALPAADSTRFFALFSSFFVESPNTFAAARTPFNWSCSLPSCFSSFLSSRLIAAKIFM